MKINTVIPSFPSFSKPLTRAEFETTLTKLSQTFQSQGFNSSDAKNLASKIISYKGQGLTDAQISKNLDDSQKFKEARLVEREKQREIARESQKDLLASLAKRRAEIAKIQAERRAGRSRSRVLTKKELRNLNKNKIVLVADPRNPRGALIPKAVADRIRLQLVKQGKDRGTSSIAQKNDPSILERIRRRLRAQKDDSQARVIAVNRNFVLLSNGKKVLRSKFTGTIPEKFLSKKRKFISTTAKDSQGNIIELKQFDTLNTVTKKTSATSTDPSKTKKPTSVFQQDKPETTPIQDATELIQDFFVNFFNQETPEAKADDLKDETKIDPIGDFLGSVTDFFGSLSKPAILPEVKAEEPKTTPTSISTTSISTTSTPTLTPETQNEKTESAILKFLKENAVKIAIGSVGAIAVGFVALASMGTSQMGINDAKN